MSLLNQCNARAEACRQMVDCFDEQGPSSTSTLSISQSQNETDNESLMRAGASWAEWLVDSRVESNVSLPRCFNSMTWWSGVLGAPC